MGGASIYCQRVLVTSGFNVTFNIRFGPITGPADVVYLSFFQSSSASAVPAWTCGSLGGGGCYSSLNRVALQLVTYGTLATGAAASSSGFVNDASGFSLIGVSNAGSFGASTSIAAGDVWAVSAAFYPASANSGTLTWSLARGIQSASFSATLDVPGALNAAPTTGDGTAWLGFGGATGGSSQEVWVTDVLWQGAPITPSQSVSLSQSPSQTQTSTRTGSPTQSQSQSTTPTPVVSYAGSSTAGYSVSGAAGLTFVADHCGIPGAATALSGSAYLTFAGSTAAVPSGDAPRSSVAWIMCPAGGLSSSGAAFEYGGGGGYTRGRFSIFVWSPTNLAFIGESNDCSTTSGVCDGSWHHVAMVYASPVLTVYLDGTSIRSCTLAAQVIPSSPGVFVGWNGNLAHAGGEIFTGAISQARIFDRSLSASAVAADLGVCPSLSPTQTASASVTASQTPTVPLANTITVLNASYGANCNTALAGNYGSIVSGFCGASSRNCTIAACCCCGCDAFYPIIADPSPGCGKSFTVYWRCTVDAPGSSRLASVPGEANFVPVSLACSQSSTATPTVTTTGSQTGSRTPSQTPSASQTQSLTLTSSATPSNTASLTLSQTISQRTTASSTATSSVTASPASTPTQTQSLTPSATASSVFPIPPLLWFDAQSLAAAGQTTGSSVALWPDSSGNHRDASQATASLRPVYYANGLGTGLPGVRFDGSTNILTGGPLTWSTPCSIVAVVLQDCAPPTTACCSGVFGCWDASNSNGYISLSTAASGGGNTLVWADYAGGGLTGAGTNLNGVQYIATVTYDGNSSRGYVNGCLAGTGPAVTMLGSSGFFIGSRNSFPGRYFNGLISELVFFATPLSASQQSSVEARLAAKWAQPYSSCWPWSNASVTAQGVNLCSASQTASSTASGTPTPSATGTPGVCNLPADFDCAAGPYTVRVNQSSLGALVAVNTPFAWTATGRYTGALTLAMNFSNGAGTALTASISPGCSTLTFSNGVIWAYIPTPSATASQTPSQLQTPTPTPTASQTRTGTSSNSATSSLTQTLTPSGTATPSASQTPSSSRTRSGTYTPSMSGTQSSTASLTGTVTQTASSSSAPTPSSTGSGTLTQANTQTRSPSGSPSASTSASLSSSQSSTNSQTQSCSGSASPSLTGSATASHTVSSTQTQTPSATQSQVPTSSGTSSQALKSSETQSTTPTLSPTGTLWEAGPRRARRS